MKFYIPAYILVDLPSYDAAKLAKQNVQNLLTGGMVKTVLQAHLPHEAILVGDPVLANVPANK